MGMNDFQIGLTAKLDDTKSKQQLNADIDDLKKQLNSVEVQAKLGKDVVSNITKQLNTAQISLQNVSIDKATINKMVSQINNALSGINVSLSNNINGNSAIQSVTRNMKIGDIKASVDVNGNITTQIETMRNSFTKLGLSTNEVKNKMSSLDTEVTNLRKLLNSGASDNKIVTQFEKVNTTLKQTQNNLKQTRSKYSLLVSEQRRLAMANTIESWNQKNSSATKEAISQNEKYIASLRDLNTQMTKMEYDKIQTGFKQTENSMRGLGKLGANLKDQISQATESFTQWVSISSVIMGTIYKVKQAIGEIKDVDDIITEISKTSDMTSEQLQKLTSSSFGKASNLGRTATDYLSGVEEMARSGYYGDQGEAMAQQSLLAQAAGDMTAELANKYVLATNAAYKLQGDAEKLNEVLDGQNMVSNRNSVAMEDMAEGMSKAGTVASSYRVSIEDLTAMIGTMEAVTKSGGDEVGNALKSILVNLQNVSSDKITKTLDRANASMTEMVNGSEQLRKPMDILRDLAKTFNELDEADPLRAEILTNVGGKYQATKLAALLKNVDMMDEMLKDYSEGSGSAMEEAEKSAANLSGRLNTLSNTWTSTINNIVNSDGLKTAVSLLNSMLSTVNKLTGALGSFGSISAITGLVQSLTGHGKIVLCPSL